MHAMRIVVFDVETDRLLAPGRRDNHHELRVTVAAAAVCCRSGDDECTTAYIEWIDGDGDGGPLSLADALRPAFDAADAIVAYNGRDFDMRVLRNHCDAADVDRWTAKLLDPFEAIRDATGSWVKLDELLDANCLPRKAGDGVSAVDWWAAGERRRVADYCRQDVEGLVALLALGRIAFPIKAWDRGRQAVTGWAELDWDTYIASSVGRSTRHGAKKVGMMPLDAAATQPTRI